MLGFTRKITDDVVAHTNRIKLASSRSIPRREPRDPKYAHLQENIKIVPDL